MARTERSTRGGTASERRGRHSRSPTDSNSGGSHRRRSVTSGVERATFCRVVTEQTRTVTTAVGFEPSADAPINEDTLEAVRLVRSLDDLSKEAPFDVALVLDVFEHIPDYVAFLRSIAHVAKMFVFHVPLEVNAFTVLTGRLGQSRPNLGHLHHFSKRTAEQSLEGAGYSVADAHYTKSGWEGEGRRPRGALNLARRAIYQVSPTATERILGGLALLVLATPQEPLARAES